MIKEYYSGWEALNLAKESGAIADWHPLSFCEKLKNKDINNVGRIMMTEEQKLFFCELNHIKN